MTSPTPSKAATAAKSPRKPPAFVMVGLPGSGKSTWAKGHPAQFPIASTDKYIEAFAAEKKTSYAKAFKKHYKTAIKQMKAEVDGYIKARQPFIWDQTNLDQSERDAIYKLLSPTHEIHFVCMIIPLEVCIFQHNLRKTRGGRDGGDVVDEKRIIELAKTATFPVKGDAADQIVRIIHLKWVKKKTP
jgi:predicted kinase